MKHKLGFTLIELMIVVAIIGVVSALALPLYQHYVARSQISSAAMELRGAKPQYELIMSNGSASNSSDFTVANMFFSTSSHFCDYFVHEPVAGISNPALECKLKNVFTSIVGESIYLNRDKNGTWSCSTTAGIDQKYKPVYCI